LGDDLYADHAMQPYFNSQSQLGY